MLSFGSISNGSPQCQTFILDLSLIDLLLVFSPSRCVILIPWFLWVLSQTIKLLVMKYFAPVFWCKFE